MDEIPVLLFFQHHKKVAFILELTGKGGRTGLKSKRKVRMEVWRYLLCFTCFSFAPVCQMATCPGSHWSVAVFSSVPYFLTEHIFYIFLFKCCISYDASYAFQKQLSGISRWQWVSSSVCLHITPAASQTWELWLEKENICDYPAWVVGLVCTISPSPLEQFIWTNVCSFH